VLGDRRVVFKKRHRQFCCVLIDQTNGRVVDVLESREKAAVKQWLTANKPGLLAHLREVTIDMGDAYAEAVKEVFGDAVRITIDRFHVMKNFQDRLNESRREIQSKLPRDEAKALKGSRWLWLTNVQNMTPEQQVEFAELKKKFPALAELSEHREELRKIFDDGRFRRPESAIVWLKRWCEQGRVLGLKPLEKFNRTLENWMERIANYFVLRSTNGPTEGFNRGLRAILWRACGMTNFNHFRLRVLHAFG
jgi:transposase